MWALTVMDTNALKHDHSKVQKNPKILCDDKSQFNSSQRLQKKREKTKKVKRS